MKLTRRSTLLAFGGSALAMPWVRPSWAQAGTVNVYNWSDYIGETTLADFEAETGIGVVYDLYASTEEMQARMLAGSTGYDVVLQAANMLHMLVGPGQYQKLDRARLSGWSNLDPAVLKILEGYDPGLEYSVPYMWGSVGMTYNLDMVRERLPDADLEDLGTILNPATAAALADCGISILDSPTDFGFMVLRYLGIDPNTAGPAEWQKMVEAIAPVRDYIATFDNSNFLTTLPNGELCAVNNWSGDYSVATARALEAGIDINLAYFVPKSGVPTWMDLWCMPVDAPNPDNAYLFMNFLLRPEVIAGCTNFTGYGNPNLASRPFVDPEILANPAIYPDAAALSRMFAPKPQTAEQKSDLIRAWTQVRTGS